MTAATFSILTTAAALLGLIVAGCVDWWRSL